MVRDLVADVNDNFRTTGVRLAQHNPDGKTCHLGPLTAASAGIPAAYFNRIFVFDPPPQDHLAAAVAWMAEHDLPFFVTVAGPMLDAVEDLADDFGFERIDQLNWTSNDSQPGMALTSLDNIPPNQSVAAIFEVTDSAGFDDFVTSFGTVFEAPPAHVEQVYRPLLPAAEARLFVGRVKGQPVACGHLEQSGDVAGIYNIGVVQEFRRQGLGEAMSWAVLRAGREAGCRVGVLQSSEMAYPLYQKMGFETVVDYYHYYVEPTV